jgi:tripartite ATP-independent transporter DctM subunit
VDAGLLILGAFVLLFVLGAPVVLAILLPSIVHIWLADLPLVLLGQRVLYALNSFPLVAVPVFIFVGNLMNSTGITDRLFRFANVLVGRLYGGLAQVNIVASLIFAGMSGSALADVGGLGRVEIKAMVERGFSPAFSGAVTAASAIVGPIFPPSIPLIIYAAVASISTVKLLVAGILPAILCVVLLMITTAAIAMATALPRAQRWPRPGELWRAFYPALPALIAPVILIYGMLSGRFTPTEAAAVTVVYILFVSAFVYRDLRWPFVRQAAMETIRSSASILIIVAAASLFGWILAIERVPQAFTLWLAGLDAAPWMLLLVVNVIFLIAGLFIDTTTATLLLVPIVAPPVVLAGVDPIHLGIVIIFNLMIGTVTPPFGLSLFLISDMTKVPMLALLRATLPFYFPLLFTLLVLTFVPEISTWIPSMMR